jgi:hypothetical protein
MRVKVAIATGHAMQIQTFGNVQTNLGRYYFAGLRETKRNKATVLLTLTLLQTPNPYPNLTLLQICF